MYGIMPNPIYTTSSADVLVGSTGMIGDYWHFEGEIGGVFAYGQVTPFDSDIEPIYFS